MTGGPTPHRPGGDDLLVQSAVLAHVVAEGNHDQTIFELAQKFSLTPAGDAVERAVRDMVGAELLSLARGKVVPGRVWFSDLLAK
jgi:hypothetical protein